MHHHDRLSWFHEARYGLFIHWGPYSVAGRGEWVMNRERWTVQDYDRQFSDQFTASRFDPLSWASLARVGAMRYAVLTTRHHDGYCLWDTKTTSRNSVAGTPRRDLIREYVAAFRDAGLRVGLYYSFGDWSHADYPGAWERDWPTDWPDQSARKRFVEFVRHQMTELLTQYGPIDVFWLDGCLPALPKEENAGLVETIHQLQPHCLINDRLGGPFDFYSVEQAIHAKSGAWESCMTLNDTWSFHAGDISWKSPRDVIRMLITAAKDAGNLLLNVGPRADGAIQQEAEHIISRTGDWLKRNGAFLSHSDRSPFSWFNSGMITTRGNCAYIHLLHSPGETLRICEIANRVLSVRYTDGSRVRFSQDGAILELHELPLSLPDTLPLTMAVELDGPPIPQTKVVNHWIPG